MVFLSTAGWMNVAARTRGVGMCTITSFPSSAVPGQSITVSGTAFPTPYAAGLTRLVLVQGTTELPIVTTDWTATQIKGVVPAAPAGAYTLKVVGPLDSCGSATTINLTAPPALAFVATPNPAAPGASILLTAVGTGFGFAKGTVTLVPTSGPSTPLLVSTWAPTEISAVVPQSTAAGSYTLRVDSGSANATNSFTVQAAAATTFPFTPPPFPIDPILPLFDDAEVVQATRFLTDAGRLADKWRYSFLKSEALAAAAGAREFEARILSLMQMVQSKVETAELLTNPVLLDAIKTLQNDVQSVQDLAGSADVQDLIKELADTATQALLLEAILRWLILNSPIQFWIGLFSAVIEDISNFDTDGTRINAYLDQQFGSGPFAAQLAGVVSELKSRVDGEIDAIGAPLRAAVQAVTRGTAQALEEVFASIETPLLFKLPIDKTQPEIPNANPLQDVTDALNQAVEDVIRGLKKQIEDLIAVPSELFKKVMFVLIVLPILAAAAVGLAGGPFTAWIFAAIVMIAVEELAHLILGWLSGPLLKQLDEIKRKVIDLLAGLKALFDKESALLRNTSPEAILRLLASQLRELRQLLPQAFTDAVAQLLASARDVVMKNALLLAHGAQQALGAENATAFDVFPTQYNSGLPPAPQLPGGTDKGLFAGDALLRDLGKLEQQRASILDGKELEITQRISIQDLLGNDRARFLELLRNGQLFVHLDEQALLDRKFPGLYRALIKDVKVFGQFLGATELPLAAAIPFMLTHLGPSRTRVKKSSNPSAPPIELPSCLGTRAQFIARFTSDQTRPQRSIGQLLDDASEIAARNSPFPDSLLQILPADNEHFSWYSLHQSYLAFVPAALAKQVTLASCGIVDSTAIEATARAIIGQRLADAYRLDEQSPFGRLFGSLPLLKASTPIVRDEMLELLLQGMPRTSASGAVIGQIAGLYSSDSNTVLGAAYDRSRSAYLDRVGRWGGARLIPDRDPHIAALGFATLERDADPETAAFNLVPDRGASSVIQAGAAAAGVDGSPLEHPSTLQYRPFENRGLDGRLLLSLPAVDPATATGLTENLMGIPATLPSALPLLADLILEVTYRACYDRNLAISVRASQARQRDELVLAAGANLPIVINEPLHADQSELRTIHLSLRAQRDRALIAWKAAKLENSAVSLPIDPTSVSLLKVTDAYSPLTSAGNTVTVQFLPSALPSLSALESTLPITLGHLGLPPTALDAAIPAGLQLVPQLSEVGFAVIPMGPTPSVVIQNISGVGAAIGATNGSTLRTLHTRADPAISTVPPASPLNLSTLDAGQFTLALGQVPIYDVIVSVTMRVPALAAATN